MTDVAERALLIGNWEYRDPEDLLKPLKGPKNDILALRKALSHPEFGLMREQDIMVVENLETPDLSTTLHEFVTEAGRGVNLLIYYSGHGERLTRGHLGLCGVEVRFSARDAQAFGTERLRGWLEENHRAGSTVIILDCCYAGQYAGRYKGGLNEDLLAESFGQGTAVLSSGGNEPSLDALRDDDPSPFTKVLAELLVEPTLTPKSGEFVSTEDIYEAILAHRPRLIPPPRRNLQAQGKIPLARRQVAEPPPVLISGLRGYRPNQLFDSIDLLFHDGGCTASSDGDVCDMAALDSNRQAAVRRLSTLADALMRTKEYANLPWWQRAVGKAWQTVGANLFEAAIPRSVQRRILEQTGEAGGTVLKVRLRFEGAGRQLEPYPWEYLQVGRGPSTVPMRGDPPISDVPLPLAVRPGLLIERVPPLPAPSGSATTSSAPTLHTVGLVNALPPLLSVLANRTFTELQDLSTLNMLFQLNGPDATWTNTLEALGNNAPRHLVLFVPINRDARPAELGFSRAGARDIDDADWRSANQLVEELRDLELSLDSLLLVTFAAAPGNDTVRGMLEFARDVADKGLTPVLFVCHRPGFERSVEQFDGKNPQTLPGLLLHALSQGVPFDRAVYYARTLVMRRNNREFEALFGVPGYYYYAPESAVQDVRTSSAGGSRKVGVISSSREALP